ncbi:MAG: hypothetical protein ABS934_02695 [Psychrobacillus sp.]
MNNSVKKILKNNIRTLLALVTFHIGIFTWLVLSSEDMILIEVILLSFFLMGLYGFCLWSMKSKRDT